jgi:hypothetical protein
MFTIIAGKRHETRPLDCISSDGNHHRRARRHDFQPRRVRRREEAKGEEFDKRLFGKPIGKDKAWACFVRRYDAGHFARHPLQKVGAMKLLVSVEYPPEDKTYRYSFRLGVKYRDRKVSYDSAGDCGHVTNEDTGNEMRLGCGIDCDGGGLGVTLAKDDKSATVELERIRIWQHSNDDMGESLVAGDDDKAFRLERASLRECISLVTDRKELAALKRKMKS